MIQFLVSYGFDSKEERDGFYAEIKEKNIGTLSRGEAGCVRYDYYLPCEDEKTLFLLEQWENVERQQAHIGQPHFALLGELKKKYNTCTVIKKHECVGLN